ncbi:MAG: hybrid sensor histidine kinase/response regulator [Magnetococcales bacterium]|nr:hybrid sensor histidine kinase/response regulator [Magnetococcales bacterium]
MVEKRETILIVDDERFNINVLKDLLDHDYDTMVARNGAQALKRVNSGTLPDLILLDIMMPEMDGYEVCKKLKEDENTRDIPVVFVTAMSDVDDEMKGFSLGAVDYLTKPISPPITLARIKTHLALKNSLEKQKELNQIKNKFLGIAAHDLRNPLTSLQGMSQLMLKIPLPEEKKTKFIESINKTSNQMLKLVNDLLDVSVIESGRFDLRLNVNNLSTVAAERAELISEIAENKGVKLVSNLSDLPDSQFDEDRICQVVDNLLTNAVKFSETGTTVTLTTREIDDKLELGVTDQGQGIPADEIDSLFGAFKKTSVKPTAGEKSTGLGLSIVKKIIEAHKGTIEVISEVGKGSTFLVKLNKQ